MKIKWTTPGRAWAYLFLALGLGVSLWANIASVHIAPPGYIGFDYHPPFVRILMAALAPGAMFGAIEVVARNPWPGRLRWQIVKWTFAISVGMWAGIISYKHLFHLANYHMGITDGSLTVEAVGTPLMVDGLILLCTAALLIPIAMAVAEVVTTLHPSTERAAALATAVDTGVGVAFGAPPREIVRIVTEVVEIPVLVETVTRKAGTVNRSTAEANGARKRYPLGSHPRYPDWEKDRMAGTPWSVEDMAKALGTTEEAARSALVRWEGYYVAAEAKRGTSRSGTFDFGGNAPDPEGVGAEASPPS
jgi:hypothetical protein